MNLITPYDTETTGLPLFRDPSDDPRQPHLVDICILAYNDDGAFKLVVFDPPHLTRAGRDSWLRAKYGLLTDDWRDDLAKGFSECFRVLATDGVLIFKWNETQVKVSEILALTDQQPLFGHKSGKRVNTHWMTFMKR